MKKVFNTSSVVDSVKSTTSDDSSWAFIVKRSLKTKVPKMNFDFMDKSSSGSTSSPKQKIESKNKNNSPEEVIIQPKEISPPPQIINISDDEDLSSIESLFMTSKNEPNQDQPVPQTIEHRNDMTPRNGHFKKHQEWEINKENRREYKLAFSATCPEEIMEVKKSKRTKPKVSSSQEQQKCIQKYLDQEQTM